LSEDAVEAGVVASGLQARADEASSRLVAITTARVIEVLRNLGFDNALRIMLLLLRVQPATTGFVAVCVPQMVKQKTLIDVKSKLTIDCSALMNCLTSIHYLA
jgi:hypothetical protein